MPGGYLKFMYWSFYLIWEINPDIEGFISKYTNPALVYKEEE